MKLVIALFLSSVSALKLDTQAKGDGDAAVAKTAAIKNIQKALTARILKRLDDGQPLVEVARKMKAIEGMQPQINDMERRLGIMQSVEPVLENAIKTLQKVVDVRGMGKKSLLQLDQEIKIDRPEGEQEEVELIVSDFGKSAPNKHKKHKITSQGEESKKENQTQSVVQKESEKQSNTTTSTQEQEKHTVQSRTSSEDSDALQAFTDAVVDKNCHSIAQASTNDTVVNATSIAQANNTSNVSANATTNETTPDSDFNAQTSTKGIGAAAAMAQDNAEEEEKDAEKKAAVDNKKKNKEKAAKDAEKEKDEKKKDEEDENKDKKVEKKEEKKDKKEKKAELKDEDVTETTMNRLDRKTEADKSAGKHFTDTHDRKNPLKRVKAWTAGEEDDLNFDEHYNWDSK